jgi:hypothetical protein
MTLNGFYVLAWVALIFAAVRFIPRAIKHDLVIRELENLDDDELAAIQAEFPDYLDRIRKW